MARVGTASTTLTEPAGTETTATRITAPAAATVVTTATATMATATNRRNAAGGPKAGGHVQRPTAGRQCHWPAGGGRDADRRRRGNGCHARGAGGDSSADHSQSTR